ncbi:MAG: NAD(P)/FAD-dependent oxidoreductase [Selenomonas sp.]|nr:NAD(P)/FAD-dependent oxidoreductase [Selenomonas sp.]MBQ1461404.1 NAD(P)/FAD-dependent oxidoreductase [Selenomonas sp.]MBQ1614577.1 NAD(P)/FAD-dependent oxidoreductase [Selenomonas sp.]MBQ4212341.1 NAD(P)/FAD-dependent oxidoreductase [Selenomonas sp.]MBQ5418820.1 NAD(P)/FAD-dependent oxidoreductase [Selenomonas sp.]
MADRKPRIVIVGAGFGGVKLAKLFSKDDVEVTLVDRHNFHLFQPLLYQVSTAVLSTDEIAYPIRTFFRKARNVEFFMAKAQGVDQARQVLLTNHGEIPYDYLILAAGATTNFFGMQEVEEHSFGMKTLQEAVHIRNHVLHMFERANKSQDEAERRKMLSFVIVGGGPTGIEEAGAISELVGIQKKEFHNLNFDEVSIKLIEATPNVLPMMPQNLREHTVDVLRKKGVDVMLNTQVVGYDGQVIKLKDGSEIPTRTLIWAAGVKAVPFIAECGGEVDRAGRIIVNEKLQVNGSENVFAIGDCANFCHGTERPLPTVAPVATQEAKVAHDNIMRLIRGDKNLETFHYKDLGAMATIGRGQAVVAKTSMNPEMTGFIAWCAWMFVHLIRLAGTHTNITVAIKWTWNLLSGTRLGRIITNIKL